MQKSQPHAIFCIPSTKYRSRKSRPQIADTNRTHESMSIEIVRLQKIANCKSQSQIANRVHESLGLAICDCDLRLRFAISVLSCMRFLCLISWIILNKVSWHVIFHLCYFFIYFYFKVFFIFRFVYI